LALDVVADSQGSEHDGQVSLDRFAGVMVHAVPFVRRRDRPPIHAAWTAECTAHRVFVHYKYNWFNSTALSEADVDSVLVATDAAFGEVAKRYSLSEQ
jgi:hypothetical protein